MILLDTNVVSEPMRQHPDRQVQDWLDDQAIETLYLSTISLSELLLGIESLPTGKRRQALAAASGSKSQVSSRAVLSRSMSPPRRPTRRLSPTPANEAMKSRSLTAKSQLSQPRAI